MAAEGITNIESHLSKAQHKMTYLQDSIKRYPDREITEKDITEALKFITESNKDLKGINRDVSIKTDITKSLSNAIKFFNNNRKTIEEKVNEVQLALFYEALETLDTHLKNLDRLKRGERVEKVDQDQL